MSCKCKGLPSAAEPPWTCPECGQVWIRPNVWWRENDPTLALIRKYRGMEKDR